ncbi:protein of unknown function [Hyphomicrobium sp. 1Nfss2.1]
MWPDGGSDRLNRGSFATDARRVLTYSQIAPKSVVAADRCGARESAALTGAELVEYRLRAAVSPDAREPKLMKWLRASFRLPEPHAARR